MNSFTALKTTTLEMADRCVKCGLCSAQCPTYLIDGSENESPRGRISLAHAIASDQISDDTHLNRHIESCLSCQRCEKICPSGVEVGKIIANTRSILNSNNRNSKNVAKTAFINWISNRSHRDWKKIVPLAQAANKMGFLRLFPQLTPVLKYIKATKPPLNKPLNNNSGELFLFTGCTSQILDQDTINEAQKILELCGFSVSLPVDQVCCGTLPHHKGLLNTAKQCQTKNLAAFNARQSPVIFLATACGATLKTYENDNFSSRVFNINVFLNHVRALDRLKFKSTNKRILVHAPCTEKNVLKEKGSVEQLLSHLPDTEIISLKESTGCCGAAGDYMLTHSEMANRIRLPLISDIEAIKPDIIVTSNYTCGIHIQNGLKEKNLDIPVMHPIRLLLKYIT